LAFNFRYGSEAFLPASRKTERESPVSDEEITRDGNGAELKDGDSVTLIKDLKVKGSSETIKRGTLVKNIRLTAKLDEIECSTKQVKGLVLRTEFLKKA
jgi:protein PhnA